MIRHHEHTLDERCVYCTGWPEYAVATVLLLEEALIRIEQLETVMTEAQSDIDADTAVLTVLATEADTIIAGIDALKAATDGTVDTSALDSALSSLKSKLDAAATDVTPAPVDTPPVDEPVSDTPIADETAAATGTDAPPAA